jgi:hypothetical protein
MVWRLPSKLGLQVGARCSTIGLAETMMKARRAMKTAVTASFKEEIIMGRRQEEAKAGLRQDTGNSSRSRPVKPEQESPAFHVTEGLVKGGVLPTVPGYQFQNIRGTMPSISGMDIKMTLHSS